MLSVRALQDRYADDVHYIGGCVLAEQMLSWSTVMFAWNARPPPQRPGESVAEWRERWRRRLDGASEPWVHKWLAHQVHSLSLPLPPPLPTSPSSHPFSVRFRADPRRVLEARLCV